MGQVLVLYPVAGVTIACLAVVWYVRNPVAASQLSAGVAALFVVGLILTIASGVFLGPGVHRPLGRAAGMAAWLAAPFLAGTAAVRGVVRRRWSSTLDIALVVAGLATVLLGVSIARAQLDLAAPEVRFEVWLAHTFCLPSLDLVLFIAVWWRLRGYVRESIVAEDGCEGPVAGPADGG